MEVTTGWKMGGGHTLQPHSLNWEWGCAPQPKFPSFVRDWEGALKCFILHDQTTGDLKSHHLQARVTLKALSLPPRPLFLSAEMWVIRYHLGREQLLLCVFPIMHYRIYSQCHSYNQRRKKNCGGGGGALTASWGGGGGACAPPGPPGFGTGTVLSRSLGGVLGIKYLHVFNFASY